MCVAVVKNQLRVRPYLPYFKVNMYRQSSVKIAFSNFTPHL